MTCPDTMFNCGQGRCILRSWVCDGENDCGSADSDEKNCTSTTLPPTWRTTPWTTVGPGLCGRGQVQCLNMNCISWYERCDGVDDCGDNSDELDCFQNTTSPRTQSTTPILPWYTTAVQCAPSMFLCDNYHRCIDGSKVCDGKRDCFDNTDEADDHCSGVPTAGPTCRFDQFQCYRGGTIHCIYQSWVCDGESDCEKGEDELDCDKFNRTCSPGSFQCLQSDGCIPRQWVCDGDTDCADGTDEAYCSTTSVSSVTPISSVPTCDPVHEFDCGYGQCIAISELCDGHTQCRSGEDESTALCDVVYSVNNLEVEARTNSSITVSWPGAGAIRPSPNNSQHVQVRVAARSSNGHFKNTTVPASQGSALVTHLQADTEYIVYVLVVVNKRESANKKVLSIRTLEGKPDPPTNLEVTDGANGYVLRWKRPSNIRGRLQKYTMYYQEISAFSTDIHSKDIFSSLKSSVETPIPLKPSVRHYHLWVTAWTNVEGEPSAVKDLNIKDSLITTPVRNLTVADYTDDIVHVTWGAPNNAQVQWYHILYTSMETGERAEAAVQNTAFIASRLSPGVVYEFTVWASNDESDGPSSSVPATTAGKKLPNAELSFLDIEDRLYIKTNNSGKLKGDNMKYMVYYSVFGPDLESDVVRSKAQNLTLIHGKNVISSLDACEIYLFRAQVVTKEGLGPLSEVSRAGTSYDPLAPPKNVEVISTKTGVDEGAMTVIWDASCIYEDLKEEYLVIVDDVEDAYHEEFEVKEKATGRGLRTTITNFYRGRTYTVSVRTLKPGSRPSRPINHTIAPYPEPEGFKAIKINNTHALLEWEPNKWTAKFTKSLGPVTYQVWHSLDHSQKSRPFDLLLSTNRTQTVTPMLDGNELHYFKVRAVIGKGFSSYSEEASVYIFGAKGSKPAKSSMPPQTKLVAIVVPCGVVILILVVFLGVYIVRHQRLQRSFLSFANSHYDTRSGTTTLNTGDDLGEEDQPMIRGFSDDEPLVIA